MKKPTTAANSNTSIGEIPDSACSVNAATPIHDAKTIAGFEMRVSNGPYCFHRNSDRSSYRPTNGGLSERVLLPSIE